MSFFPASSLQLSCFSNILLQLRFPWRRVIASLCNEKTWWRIPTRIKAAAQCAVQGRKSRPKYVQVCWWCRQRGASPSANAKLSKLNIQNSYSYSCSLLTFAPILCLHFLMLTCPRLLPLMSVPGSHRHILNLQRMHCTSLSQAQRTLESHEHEHELYFYF
jgi:hypothetical protein